MLNYFDDGNELITHAVKYLACTTELSIVKCLIMPKPFYDLKV